MKKHCARDLKFFYRKAVKNSDRQQSIKGSRAGDIEAQRRELHRDSNVKRARAGTKLKEEI